MSRFGLLALLNAAVNGGIRLHIGDQSTKFVHLKAPSAIPGTSHTIILPTALPASGTEMMTINNSGQIASQAIPSGSGGGLTSVGLTMPADFTLTNNPLTANGNIAITRASQTGNRFLASPDGTSGTPAYRAIVWGDVSSLIGTSGTSFAAGNDGRFHTQNTDTGTNQTNFVIDSSATNTFRLKNNNGSAQVRNKADTGFAALETGNLTVNGDITVTGTTTYLNTTELNIGDNIFRLNADVLGTVAPTENAGVEVNRGNQTVAQLLWDEANDKWVHGIVGALHESARTRRFTFTSTNLTAGKLTLNHNFNNTHPIVQLWTSDGFVAYPDEIRSVDANNVELDVTNMGVSTTNWTCVITG